MIECTIFFTALIASSFILISFFSKITISFCRNNFNQSTKQQHIHNSYDNNIQVWDDDWPDRDDWPRRWFEHAGYYYPNASEVHNTIPDEDRHQWMPDRVLIPTVERWIAELDKSQDDEPLFLMIANVITHSPFDGRYDVPEAFDTPDPGPHRVNERYDRVMSYMDTHFIGEGIDMLRRRNPHTVVFICGDHGAREVPDHRDNPLFDQTCSDLPFDDDAQFLTTGVILYLGDPEVGTQLGIEPGSTDVVADHADFMSTLEEFAALGLPQAKLTPTAAVGRSLLHPNKQLDASRVSMSTTMSVLEMRKPEVTFRAFIEAPDGQRAFDPIFPTCMASAEPFSQEDNEALTREALIRVKYLNWLLSSNRIYHPDFADPLNTRLPDVDYAPDETGALVWAALVIVLGGGLIVGLILTGLFHARSAWRLRHPLEEEEQEADHEVNEVLPPNDPPPSSSSTSKSDSGSDSRSSD